MNTMVSLIAASCLLGVAALPRIGPPSGSIGFCGVAGNVTCDHMSGWSTQFASANINWFWNWGLKPRAKECVPANWHFLPNAWGPKAVPKLKPSPSAPHSGPGAKTYDLAPILLGWNEPDIIGRCVGNPKLKKPSDGFCKKPGSVGWWFPDAVNDPLSLMSDWNKQYQEAKALNYDIASPAMAVHTDTWLTPFVEKACSSGHCPSYLVFHFYAKGCSDTNATLAPFRMRLEDSMKLITKFPTIKGVLITEAGLTVTGVPKPGSHPTCPNETKVSLMQNLFRIMSEYKRNGESIVKHFAWFSEPGHDWRYDLSLMSPATGNLSALGEAYVEACKQWAQGEGVRPTSAP